LKAEFYVFSQEIVNRRAFGLLGKDESTFSLGPRAQHTFTTAEVITHFDTTDARFGSKYEGWGLIIRDAAGKIVYRKTTNPTWANHVEKFGALSVGQPFYTDFKTIKRPGGIRSF
jgi:hypothetical protein